MPAVTEGFFRFTDLPPELRVMIYHLVLARNAPRNNRKSIQYRKPRWPRYQAAFSFEDPHISPDTCLDMMNLMCTSKRKSAHLHALTSQD
jgi:hypothetical protein